jgi:hypothetical protein
MYETCTMVLFMAAGLAVVAGLSLVLLLRWGTVWGSTADERDTTMPGDEYLADGAKWRLKMTRAISIDADPETVWPWIAQLGRGAGWFSVERLDNGGKQSARHLVSWVPEPQLGDAAAIGYLRHYDPPKEMTWWLSGEKWFGATFRMVVDFRLSAEGKAGSRLVMRVSGDARGAMAHIVGRLFQIIDTIMACRQLLGIKERAEKYGVREIDPEQAETGERDQYQLYEIIYASGERAGVSGKEKAPKWRKQAEDDGVL